MPQESGLAAIAHVIQISVAPVFLLTGIGALLAVLTNRLARIIDRGRALEAAVESAAAAKRREIEGELKALRRRSGLINYAISLVTTSALLVCAVIAALFFGAFFSRCLDAGGSRFHRVHADLIGGLGAFLREVHVAIGTAKIGPRA